VTVNHVGIVMLCTLSSTWLLGLPFTEIDLKLMCGADGEACEQDETAIRNSNDMDGVCDDYLRYALCMHGDGNRHARSKVHDNDTIALEKKT
jgi:hypothetical protein